MPSQDQVRWLATLIGPTENRAFHGLTECAPFCSELYLRIVWRRLGTVAFTSAQTGSTVATTVKE